MRDDRKRKRGLAEDAVRILEARGYEAMTEFLAAASAGRPAPEDCAAYVRPSFVYLAFFGVDGQARYLKIGIADNVRVRMSSYRTHCPLPCVRLLTLRLPNRGDAYALEIALLASMGDLRLHGEWVAVDGAQAAVSALTYAATNFLGRPVNFAEA